MINDRDLITPPNEPEPDYIERDRERLTGRLLKNLGFEEVYNNSLELFVYQKEDIVIYETLGGYKYNSSGIILNTFGDLQNEVTEEFGEGLEY